MGRKGVSKRKPSKKKAEVLVVGTAGSSGSANAQAAESQPAQALGIGKNSPPPTGSDKSSVNWKKGPKKG